MVVSYYRFAGWVKYVVLVASSSLATPLMANDNYSYSSQIYDLPWDFQTKRN
jgi:hypothetical protein